MSLSWLAVGLVLLLPWMLASLWLRTLWTEPEPGVWPSALGYGFMLAMVGVALILGTMGLIGLAPSVLPVLAIVLLLVWLGRDDFNAWIRTRPILSERPRTEQPWWARLFWMLLALYLLVRLLGLGLELALQPVFAWDAWTTWIFRTKAWAESGQFVTFVSPGEWLAGVPESASAYTIAAAGYPSGVSLIALWPVLARGEWNEMAMSLPWLGCVMALGLGFYGQVRLWGAGPLTALVFLYVLASLPLLDSHVALVGYADLWLATSLGLAAIAFLQWVRTGDRRQLGLWILLALACLLFKREGAVWILLFLPALIAARVSRVWRLGLLACLIALVIAGWMSGGLSGTVPILGTFSLTPTLIDLPWIGRFDLTYYNSWPAVRRHLFVYDNWHLLGYLLLFAIGAGLVRVFRAEAPSWLRAQMTFTLGSLILFYLLFFMTGAHLWAEKATSLNRLILHFVPVYVFGMMTLWELVRSSQLDGERPANAVSGRSVSAQD